MDLNTQISMRLDEAGGLLLEQGASPFRVQAYRRGAETVRRLDRPVNEILDREGVDGLRKLPGIGDRLAIAIRDIVRLGRLPTLDRLRGESDAVELLETVPGIGPVNAQRLHDDLGIDSLEDLETAAHDGRLANVAGLGHKRVTGIMDSLASRLGGVRTRAWRAGSHTGAEVVVAPGEGSNECERGMQECVRHGEAPVEEILDVDREYRTRAEAGELHQIAPRRFNPEGEAWLPVLHTQRGERHYTVLFSNTAHAHQLGKTHDWVILYYDGPDDAPGGERQATVITSQFGVLKGSESCAAEKKTAPGITGRRFARRPVCRRCGVNATETILKDLVRDAALPLTGSPSDYDALLDLIGDARFVLMGEASHGTHEFYRERAQITKRLIREKGFTAVAVEADWPDAYRVNRFVRGQGDDADATDALSGFERFPAWMWRNADVLDFIGWLRDHNDSLAPNQPRAGFYGLDLYSMHASIQAVLAYLDKVDPEGAERARHRYACFENFGEDPQEYGYAVGLGLSDTCEREVIEQVMDLQRRAADYARRDGRIAAEDFFYAEQSARLVKDAEEYYRAMFRGRVWSWNLRDQHMAETLDALAEHLERRNRGAKVVVWAHNSHLGDARATQMGRQGELNVGQLVPERYGRECALIGFTTYTGTVTAASNWGGPAERKCVRPALPQSFEAAFHSIELPRFLLNLREGAAAHGLAEPLLERAIGVIYLPESEFASHYFYARLSRQFDAVLHFDHTRAVEPLERNSRWIGGEPAETFPSGI